MAGQSSRSAMCRFRWVIVNEKWRRNGRAVRYCRNSDEALHSSVPESISDSSWWPLARISEKACAFVEKQPLNSICVRWRTETASVGKCQRGLLIDRERMVSRLRAKNVWTDELLPPSKLIAKCVRCLKTGNTMSTSWSATLRYTSVNQSGRSMELHTREIVAAAADYTSALPATCV